MNILCFGEPLIRLATPAHSRLDDAQQLELSYGGAESVVAISLALQNEQVSYATKVSNNSLGSNALNSLARYGIDISRVMRSNDRMGLYYTESGRSIRPSIVTYDRSDTAMANARHTEFDWDRILNGVSTFFFSGVVPAISPEMELTCLDGLIACKGRGIRTILDLNYRETMWPREAASKALDKLLPYIDELIASEDDIISLEHAKVSQPEAFDFCSTWISQMKSAYDLKSAAFVLRQTTRYDIVIIKGAYLVGDTIYTAKPQHVTLTDISSCGSVYSAGIIHGETQGWDPQYIVNYATMASAYKATIEGDLSYAREQDISTLLEDGLRPHIRQ